MKVLFGINNDETVKSIVEYYEAKYKEKIEYKCVYYFKQFRAELEKGDYERAVLIEELERFPTNNQAQIDDYLFNNIDSMTDTFDSKNIVYISSDRRRLGDEFLTRLFNLGVYTTLVGNNRTKTKVAEAIKDPYLKKDVKKYYDTPSGSSVYKSAEVSELEIQRIISYYKNQNGVADKYNEIFYKIAEQYTNEQLKIIINFLPDDIRQYLSFNNDKYKEIMNMPNVEASIPQKQEKIVDKTAEPSIVIKKEPSIIEKIVVKQVQQQAPVLTEVVEKEVLRSVYEVPKDYKKVVCFVGAPKVGTTFCINAIGTYLAKSKIKTAIVDVTRKRDTYIMYTYDNEGKRSIAAESLKYASNGMNQPLMYEKLSVYTGVPGEDRKQYNASRIIDTIMLKNNVVLLDTDFTTPIDFFRLCQEIYIVQDMDILNVPQVTAFLSEIKNRGIPLEKVRIIVNKHVKCALTVSDIIEGITTYTSYDLKTYKELLQKNTLPSYIIPFDVSNYKKYVEMVYKYSNQFSSFTDDFKVALNKIINAIYPIGATNAKNNLNTNKKKIKFSDMIEKISSTAKYFKKDTENAGIEKEIK